MLSVPEASAPLSSLPDLSEQERSRLDAILSDAKEKHQSLDSLKHNADLLEQDLAAKVANSTAELDRARRELLETIAAGPSVNFASDEDGAASTIPGGSDLEQSSADGEPSSSSAEEGENLETLLQGSLDASLPDDELEKQLAKLTASELEHFSKLVEEAAFTAEREQELDRELAAKKAELARLKLHKAALEAGCLEELELATSMIQCVERVVGGRAWCRVWSGS